jgi:hypothetical protein
MRHNFRRLAPRAAALLLGLALLASGAIAQDAPEQPLKQIMLTEAQVTNFIAAQPDLAGVSGKMQAAGNEPDAALEAELDAIAKKHGFSSFEELDDVAANISIIMAGLDAEGVFTDPIDALKKELESVEADAAIPEEDKKELVGQLTEAIKTTPPLQHKENVELVKAHREAIEKALQ